jgi:hypothetical protein
MFRTTLMFVTCLPLIPSAFSFATADVNNNHAQSHQQSGEVFRFESIDSLDQMQRLLETRFPRQTSRNEVRKAFVTQGGAKLIGHPNHAGVEKYIYDINLCNYYIWRWNISVDYDASARVQQLYMNGEPIFADGKQKKDGRVLGNGARAAIYKITRPRPEAFLGEKELQYTLIDGDGDLKTTDDQVLTGGGPSRSSIAILGRVHMYSNVEPWRSIFDSDSADKIAEYSGNCADEIEKAKQSAAH